MKVSTTIAVEQKTRNMIKTLAQVMGTQTSDLWQEAAEAYLHKYYAATLRKAAKQINSVLEEAEG